MFGLGWVGLNFNPKTQNPKINSGKIISERSPLKGAVRRHALHFHGEVVHLSSNSSEVSMDNFLKVGMSGDNTFLFAHRGRKSGALGLGLRALEHEKLKKQLPFYLERNKRGVILVREGYQSFLDSWQELYNANIAFARAA